MPRVLPITVERRDGSTEELEDFVANEGELAFTPTGNQGQWKEFRITRPCCLVPTWSPINTSGASAAIVPATDFDPALYYSQGTAPIIPAGAGGPAAINTWLKQSACGRIYFDKPGKWYVVNPNGFGIFGDYNVPYVIIDCPDLEVVDLIMRPSFGNTMFSAAFQPPASGGAVLQMLGWDSYRIGVIFQNTAAPAVNIGFQLAPATAGLFLSSGGSATIAAPFIPQSRFTLISNAALGSADQVRAITTTQY